MKYINSIINCDVDITSLISDRSGLKQLSILMVLPVAMAGVVIFSGMIPLAAIMDSGRYLKLQYLKHFKCHNEICTMNKFVSYEKS